ncbi:PAS domain S-box protein [Trichocoleus sp. ST-U3]|uniref:PAS domain S-box protein n=1 Tax=Coleofasciculus sp. FACHB-542 TaxID=2692787 RepID=UPI001684700A|nr:PAS domain S-box protein [Coleofasciculus sp. FACHB-542]MBD2083949.1 PAS domain S-box protein [Coleofasciculus sp. FACHB-542]
MSREFDMRLKAQTLKLLKAKEALQAALTRCQQTEAKLHEADEELEKRVRNRTAELAQANEQLQHEINQRQQTEALLRQNEQMYRRVLDATGEGIWIIDAEGKTTYVNQQTAEMLGYSSEEILGRPAFDFLFEEDLAEAHSYYQRMQQGTQEQHEWRWRCKNDRELWVFARTSPLFGENGQFQGAIGIFTDISNRRQVQEARTESDRFFQATFNQAAVGIAHVSIDGQWLLVNQKLCDIVGYTPEELRERTFQDITHPDDLNADLEHVRQMLASEIQTYSIEKRSIRKDGSQVWINLTVSLVREPTGEPKYFISVIENIDERKRAEQALEQSLKELSDIKFALDKAAIAVATDEKGTINYVNDKFCQISKYAREELIGQSHRLINSGFHSKEFFQNLWATISDGKIWQGEIKNRAKDGTCYWVDTTIVPFLNDQGKPFQYLAIRFDITKRKQAEEALQQSEERLRLALEAAQMGIWDWNILTNQVTWTDNNEKLFGLAPGSFEKTYDAFFGYIHLEDRESVQQAAIRALEENQGYEQEFRIVWPDGSIRWMMIKSQLLCNETGRAVRMIGTTLDITKQKLAQSALTQQTERQRLVAAIAQRIRQSLDLDEILNTTVIEVRELLQTDRVIVYRFQPDWSGVVMMESVGSGCKSLQGSTISKPLGDIYVQRHQQGEITAIEDIHTAHLDKYHFDLLAEIQVRATLIVPILQRGRDEIFTVAENTGANAVFCTTSPTPILWGLLCVHECSQPRQWQQLEIDLLTSLANQLAIAIEQAALFKQVQQMNSNLERQVQKRTTQLQKALGFDAVLKRITDKVRDSLDESQILQAAVRELALSFNMSSCHASLYNLEQETATICYEYAASMPSSKGRVLQMASFPEIYRPLRQGKHFQLCSFSGNSIHGQASMLACPMFDDQGVLGDLWLFHHPDYTFNNLEIRLVKQVANQCAIAIRQARLYQTSLAQVQELEKLNQLKDDFLSTVSHELRTPIANMKMAIQMLKVSPTGDRSQRYLQILQTECNRETELINDLLDLQRLAAASYPSFLATAIDLPEWLPNIIESFRSRIQEREQILQVDIPSNLPTLVSELASVERILTELLNNACKYTPPGERITVTVRAASAMMQIKVSNSGVEIPPDELPRIFDKFYRIPRADRWKQGGTGLGLALVQKLTQHLGGILRVRSASEEITFTLELPLTHPMSGNG